MKPTFLYIPTTDLASTAQFYRDVLGLEESWREGDDTIAFALPDSPLQLIVSSAPGDLGPMYLVPSVADWMGGHAELDVVQPLERIPGGSVVGYRDPAGNAFYIFDQTD